MRRKLLERRWGNCQAEEKEDVDEIVEIDVDETLPTRGKRMKKGRCLQGVGGGRIPSKSAPPQTS
jgi:hypothetical protein